MTEFITRNYGQKEFEVIIKTGNKEHYKAAEDFARKMIDHTKQQTNADRIRAMSDEELEDVIRAMCIGYEPWCDHHCKMQGEDNCNICLKKLASAAIGGGVSIPEDYQYDHCYVNQQ